ncbi:surface protease GP63, partial [Trypanosoma rangeli]
MCRSRSSVPFIPLVLFLLLLAMHCTGGCLAAAPALRHRCNFDEMMRKNGPPTAMVRELPRKGQGTMQAYTATTKEDEGDWKPIRIRAFVVAENDTSVTCIKA